MIDNASQGNFQLSHLSNVISGSRVSRIMLLLPLNEQNSKVVTFSDSMLEHSFLRRSECVVCAAAGSEIAFVYGLWVVGRVVPLWWSAHRVP